MGVVDLAGLGLVDGADGLRELVAAVLGAEGEGPAVDQRVGGLRADGGAVAVGPVDKAGRGDTR